jgi:hypothetical protein
MLLTVLCSIEYVTIYGSPPMFMLNLQKEKGKKKKKKKKKRGRGRGGGEIG